MAVTNISTKDRAYRVFACWAVRRAWELTPSEPWKEVVLKVESFLRGEVALSTIRRMQKSRLNAAAAVWTCGISRGSPTAAVQLAALATAGTTGDKAAEIAIEWLALAAGFRALSLRGDAQELAAGFRAGGPWDRARDSNEAKAEKELLESQVQRWLIRAAAESGVNP